MLGKVVNFLTEHQGRTKNFYNTDKTTSILAQKHSHIWQYFS